MDRWGVREPLVLLVLLTIVGGTWGFIRLANLVAGQTTQHFDERMLLALRRPDEPARPVGPAWLHEVARDVTALGGVTALALLTAAVAGFLLLRGQTHAMWLVLVATAGGLLISLLLKGNYERPRPSVVLPLTQVHTSSFPSGHSMMSAVVYLTLGSLLARLVARRRLKLYILAVAVLLTLLVGLSRVYLGVHYPTDVLAGWMAGLVWALLCWLVARHLQRRGAVEAELAAE